MRKPNVFIIMGLPGAGKTTASSFFKTKNFRIVSLGDAIRAGGKIRFKEAREKIIREEMRVRLGEDVFAKKAYPFIEKAMKAGSHLIIEGVRSRDELDYLRNRIKMRIILIKTRRILRKSRLGKRDIRPLRGSEFDNREKYEQSMMKRGSLSQTADAIIDNSQDVSNFISQLDKLT